MDHAAEAERNTNEAQTRVIEELRKAAAFRYEGMKLSGMTKSKTWIHTLLPNHLADCGEKPVSGFGGLSRPRTIPERLSR